MIMKNKKSIILSISISCALLVGALALFILPTGSGDILDDGVRRDESALNNGLIYIDPNIVALAGELNGTAESQAAARAAFDQINAQRQAAGLRAFSWSNALEQASAVRAVEATQVWSHTRPDGTDYWTVNSNVVYGENLAKGYSDAASVVKGWNDSPTHKENMMYSFKTAAIAVHVCGDQWYWANEFGY